MIESLENRRLYSATVVRVGQSLLIGGTAGADGIAISFCDGEERAFLRDIERLIRISIPSVDRRGESRRPGVARAEGFGPLPRSETDRPQRPPHRGARPGGSRPEYRGTADTRPVHAGPRHEGARHEGPRHEGPRHEGVRREGAPRSDDRRTDAPRKAYRPAR